MKLQDALKKIIKEFGMSVLKEKRLVSILADYKVFDDYPAAKQVMKSIVEDGYGKELCRLGMDGSSEECLGYAERLKKILVADQNFKPKFADYAVDCIMFSMGLASSVIEPSDHGFDPFGNCTGSRGQIGCGATSDVEPKDTSNTGIQRQNAQQIGNKTSSDSLMTGTGSTASQQHLGSAGVQDDKSKAKNSPITPDTKYYSDKHYSLQSIAGWFTSKGRIGRTEFWCRIIVSLAVFTGLILLLLWCSRVFHHLEDAAILLGVFFSIVFLVSFVCTLVKRCHDLCWSGWAAFMLIWPLRFVPPLARSGSYWVLLVLSLVLGLYWIRVCIGKGTDGENKYGPDPTSNVS